jgi:hypothetical protein
VTDRFEHAVVDPTVMLARPDSPAFAGVEEDDIGVRSYGDCTLFGNNPKSFAGVVDVSSTRRLSDMPCLQTPPSWTNGKRVFDARGAVGNFAEACPALLF